MKIAQEALKTKGAHARHSRAARSANMSTNRGNLRFLAKIAAQVTQRANGEVHACNAVHKQSEQLTIVYNETFDILEDLHLVSKFCTEDWNSCYKLRTKLYKVEKHTTVAAFNKPRPTHDANQKGVYRDIITRMKKLQVFQGGAED